MIHSDRHKGPQEAKYLCPNTRWISSIRVILSMLPRCVRRATIGPYGSVHQITPPLPTSTPPRSAVLCDLYALYSWHSLFPHVRL